MASAALHHLPHRPSPSSLCRANWPLSRWNCCTIAATRSPISHCSREGGGESFSLCLCLCAALAATSTTGLSSQTQLLLLLCSLSHIMEDSFSSTKRAKSDKPLRIDIHTHILPEHWPDLKEVGHTHTHTHTHAHTHTRTHTRTHTHHRLARNMDMEAGFSWIITVR